MKWDLKEIINKHSDLVYTVAMFTLRSPADVDDVVQDVYVKLSDNLHKINDEVHLERWLRVVTRNTSNNYNLRFWRRAENVLIENRDTMTKDINDEFMLVKEKINSLSDTYKKTFVMYAKGYSYEEISKKLKISNEAARKRVERAKEIIKENIFEEGESHEK